MAHQDDLRRPASMLEREQTHRDHPTIAPPAAAEMANELDRMAENNHAMARQLELRADELRSVARRLRGYR